jgi:hypothetical protein
MNKAYFRGMPTGKWYDNKGDFINRIKLVVDAFKHPDVIEAHFNGFFEGPNYWKEDPDSVTQRLPEGALDYVREELCEIMSSYKYLIIIDGHVSTWARSG